jgi:hypothetical protein
MVPNLTPSNNIYYKRGIPAMSVTNSTLRPWAAVWRHCLLPPRWQTGYVMDEHRVPEFPGCELDYDMGSDYPDRKMSGSGIGQETVHSPTVGRGMFTHIPADMVFRGMQLPAWGSEFGSRDERESWVNRDILGQFVLIRVMRTQTDMDLEVLREDMVDWIHGQRFVNFSRKPPYHENGLTTYDQSVDLEFYPETPEVPTVEPQLNSNRRYEWMFAYLNSYNSYTGQHELVFKFDDIHFRDYWVDLDRCMFQQWTRPDMRRHMTNLRERLNQRLGKLGRSPYHRSRWSTWQVRDTVSYLSAVKIQKVWRRWHNSRGLGTSGKPPEGANLPLMKADSYRTKPVKYVVVGRNRKYCNNYHRLPQRNPLHHPEETVGMTPTDLEYLGMDDTETGDVPLQSRYDQRQWYRKRSQKQYWERHAKNSVDWYAGEQERCVQRTKTKWNTARRVPTKKRRDRRRATQRNTMNLARYN